MIPTTAGVQELRLVYTGHGKPDFPEFSFV